MRTERGEALAISRDTHCNLYVAGNVHSTFVSTISRETTTALSLVGEFYLVLNIVIVAILFEIGSQYVGTTRFDKISISFSYRILSYRVKSHIQK